jgi:hypothetical protein
MAEVLDIVKVDLKNDSYYLQNFPNEGQRFLAWYLRNCYNRTSIQSKDDITDGPNDKEFDAVIVDDEKRQIIVIQSKFYAGSVDHQPLQEILAAWLQIQNLPALQASCNGKLQIKLEAVSAALEDGYEVVFELVTTGQLTTEAKNDLAAFQSTISEFEHPEASVTLVDSEVIRTRWTEAAGKELPKLTHIVALEPGRYLAADIANFKTVVAAVPLADCLKFPGISDGKLFRSNVRQFLGLTNKVSKGMKQTINGENPQYFFFYHNGLTALCEKLSLDTLSHQLKLDGLGIVNGCQSLTTILACSERVKSQPNTRVLVRFYEIPQRDLADKISVYTNSQSAVKPRDLRSNDKRVLALKKAYEGAYPAGYFITKRGEVRPPDRDETLNVEIGTLAKYLMAWHCRRPNIANNENKLFDKYFEQLFKADYSPIDIAGLAFWGQHIEKKWNSGLPLNEALLASPSNSKFHLFYTIQQFFAAASNQLDKVPAPSATVAYPHPDRLIEFAANCYNSALEAAVAEYQEKGKIFSPQNWLKAKDSLLKLSAAVNMFMSFMSSMPGGAELKKALVLAPNRFSLRWAAE